MTETGRDTWAANRELSRQLMGLTADVRPAPIRRESDAIVAHIEVNEHHGVGVLIQRLFGQSDGIVSIRSHDFYAGQQQFGEEHVCIAHGSAGRDQVFWNVLEGLPSWIVKRVVCVPYFVDDARTAIALKQIFGAPLCTYLMDDQNLSTDGIPDSVMAELLARSTLRLAISPQLCAGYQHKYGHPMWLMPPLVPDRLIPKQVNEPPPAGWRSGAGVIVGNIWGQRWIELLRETVRDSGVTLDWHNNGQFRWLPCSIGELARDGVIPQEGPRRSDAQLVEILRRAPFVVVPSGTLDDSDDRHFIAQLSLPSRIPFVFATSHTPLLVLGSPETAAARFVVDAGVGLVAPYERHAFRAAVDQVTDPEVNRGMRRAAFRLADRFTDRGAADWIWSSLANGQPIDGRYEDLLGKHP